MKLKMISFVMVLLLGQALNVFPQITPKVSDFRISIDNSSPTFFQYNPVLFSNSNKEFIVAWEDYRLGNTAYFAQRFDSLGNKIDTNFRVHSNELIVQGNNSEFFNVYTILYSSPLGGGVRYFYGSIYDNNNNALIEDVLLNVVSIPWCGTGYLGIDIKGEKTGNGYLYGLSDDGYLTVKELDDRLNLLHEWSIYDRYSYFNKILNFDFATAGTNKLIAWVKSRGYEMFADYDTLSLLYSLKKDTSDIFSDSVFAGSYIIKEPYSYYKPLHLITFNTSDSTFMLFTLRSDSLVLSYRTIKTGDSSISEETTFNLIDTSNVNLDNYHSVQKFNVSQIGPDKFILYVNTNLGDYYQTNVFFFDNSGELIAQYNDTSGVYASFGGKPFILSENEFLTARRIGNDVFLVKNNLFEETDTLKINDDYTGSNDTKPSVTSINETTYFVTWENETGIFGIKVYNNGTRDENRIKLEGKQCIFFGENKCFNFWEKEYKDNQEIHGYTIYDENWDIIKQDTIVHGLFYNIQSNIKKLNDSLFVVIFKNATTTKLALYDCNGSKIKEITITTTGSYGNRIFVENANSFWVKWNNNLQLYSGNLEPLSDIYENDANVYLGNSRFLKFYSDYETLGIVWKGIILSAEGDTLVQEFELEKIPNESDAQPKIMPLKDKSEFAVLFTEYRVNLGRHLYWQVYGFDGLPKPNFHRINSNGAKWTQNITYTINGNDVFFVWADIRDGNLGYDIYGNIYDSRVITAISKDEIPNILPEIFVLYQNYPNPFNPSTRIKYSIPQLKTLHAKSQQVQLKIYDILGREIATLVNEKQSSGNYEVTFDATGLPSGIYFYKLTAGSFTDVKKMILMK